MLRRVGAVLSALAVAAMIVVTPATAAVAAGSCVPSGDDWVCTGDGQNPGNPGTPPDSGGGEAPIGFVPGPSECLWKSPESPDPVVVDCSDANGGYWSNTGQCYWYLADPQREPPFGQSASVGAWYRCSPICNIDNATPGDCTGTWQWRDAPPPGIARYTPAQAAAALATRLVLSPIPIGMAPAEKVHSDDPPGTAPYRRTWVGIPVWLWVDNPTEEQWGSQTISDTIGGVTITLTASTTGLWWDSGDGQQITCGAGTPFDINYWYNKPAEDSPDCGWRYEQTGTFTVTAISTWSVEWTGGGETGDIQMPSTSTSTTVQVGELQSVNVLPDEG